MLPSYDAYWAVDNNLPVDAVLADADSLPAAWQPTVQLLCCYAEGETPVVPYVDGAQDPTWVQNTYAYPTQAEGDTGLAVFVGICAVLTLCAVFGLCSIQLRRRQQGLVTLRMIGAAKGMILRLCLWETVLLLAVSLPLGAVLGAALCVAGLAVQGNLEYFSVPAGQLCAGLALALWPFWRVCCCQPYSRPGRRRPICRKSVLGRSAGCAYSVRCRCESWR